MSAESPKREFLGTLGGNELASVVLLGIIVLLVAACGGQESSDSSNDPGKQEAS